MLISDVLTSKGSAVVSLAPTATVRELLATLSENRVGAVVVLDGGQLVGIVSERDVVRQLHRRGAAVLQAPVADVMTTDVTTSPSTASLEEVSVRMTERRIRHLPVVDDGRLVGLVSIGDVVKSHIASLEQDREQLTAYISQG